MIQAPRAILFLGCALLSARTALGSGAQVLTHGQLKPGKIVSAKIGAGRSHVYELPLEAGQFVHLVLYTPGFPVLLNLSSIERKFAGGAGRKESFYWLSDQSNKFRLELSSEEPGKPALFKLELQGLRPATPQDQQRVSGYRALDRARRAIDDHEYKQAVADLEQVVALFQQAADRQLEAETLLNLGIAWDKQYDHQRSAAYFEKSLALYREIKEPDGEGDALRNLAYQYFDLDQSEKALASLDQALAAFRSAKDRDGEARVLNQYGNASGADHDRAVRYYQSALSLARAADDRMMVPALLHNLGRIMNLMDRQENAIRYFEMSHAAAHARQDRLVEGADLDALGYVYNNLNRFDEAIRCFQQALPIFRDTKDRFRESGALNNLGLAYSNLNQFERAVPYYQEALAGFREVHDRRMEGITLHNLAWNYDSLGQHEKVSEYYKPALAIAMELHDPQEEARLIMDFEKGIPELEHAVALLREAKDRQAEAWTLSILAGAYRKQRQFDKAVQSASQAVAVAHGIKDPLSEAGALALLMGVYKENGAPRLAVFYGKRAVNVTQAVRAANQGLTRDLQRSLFKGSENMYHTLADLLISQGRLDEAEQVMSLLKDEEYFNFLRRDSNGADIRTRTAGMTPEEAAYDKRFTQIQDRLVEIGVERATLAAKASLTAAETERLGALEQEIAAGNAVFAKFINELRTDFDSGSQAARVQQLADAQGIMEDLRDLPTGTVAIYTLVAEDNFRAILVTPDVQKAYEYPIPAADLNRKVFEFRTVLQNPSLDPRPLAHELYSIIVEKMAADLKQANAQTLMWSLDGTLRYLPVAALFDGEHYLIENFAVSEFTPVSNARLKERPIHDWKAAGFGVTKGYDGEPALPSVASELTNIIARKPGEHGVLKGEIKLDDDFTQQAMRATLRKRFQVVHIASHFTFQPGNEIASSLLLGDGTHLTLATLKTMPSLFGGVQLLTLSACNTGMGGEGANGQEVEGFGRLAQDRGAKAVIASLWSVMDSSTSLLMQQFYRLRQSSTEITKAEALRQAQLVLLRGELYASASQTRGVIRNNDVASNRPRFELDPAKPYAHPYYWAAFFLMGNWL